ncbi:16399_t:CDS:2 [Dentiscutata heterogama]|uniref:16399_t:CDS:1 n=1 Tax=Dentiscutata heterogama TaxID=1316150 RepID=A0ACA9MAS1_9GLOM|nr:16399_t:CDS:2 [Dentiscutata heterogama]
MMHNENTYDLESGEPIICDSVIAVQENEDIGLGCSKKKLFEGMIFQDWKEAFDTLTLYSQHEGFKLRKGRVEKTSNGAIRKRTMLCEHSEMQKIQRVEIKSCLNYHASAITKDEMIKYQEPESDDTLFVEDDEDIMQISINYILENIDINEIKEIWAIRVITASTFYQLTGFAKSNINRLFTPMTDLRDERKENINERKLYGELWGIARNLTQKAVQFHRQDVLKKLQNLLTEIQEDDLVNSPANDDNDETCSNSLDDNEICEESNSLAEIPLQNPKKRKAKGRPKSSR